MLRLCPRLRLRPPRRHLRRASPVVTRTRVRVRVRARSVLLGKEVWPFRRNLDEHRFWLSRRRLGLRLAFALSHTHYTSAVAFPALPVVSISSVAAVQRPCREVQQLGRQVVRLVAVVAVGTHPHLRRTRSTINTIRLRGSSRLRLGLRFQRWRLAQHRRGCGRISVTPRAVHRHALA